MVEVPARIGWIEVRRDERRSAEVVDGPASNLQPRKRTEQIGRYVRLIDNFTTLAPSLSLPFDDDDRIST